MLLSLLFVAQPPSKTVDTGLLPSIITKLVEQRKAAKVCVCVIVLHEMTIDIVAH
jgi:hypothetical protein